MKTFLSFILFFTFSLELCSQTDFNKAYHDINEVSNPFIVEIFGDTYFTTSNIGAEQVGKTALYKHSGNGNLKFKSGIPLLYYTAKHAYKTNDNKLLVIGVNSFCDVLGPMQVNFISKIDTNGTPIFFTTYTLTVSDHYKTSLQYSDSSYYSFTDSVLFKNSKTGLFVSKTNTGLNSISSSLLLGNNSILLSAKQGTLNSLVTISASGSTLSAKPFPVLLKKLSFYNDQKIIGLGTDGKLYKISPSFDLISSSTFSNNTFINGFETRNDSIYTISSTNSFISNFSVTDTSFNSILLTSTLTHSLIQTAICLNGNKVSILAESKSKISPSWPGDHYFVSFSQIDKTGSNNFTHDVAIKSITADTLYAVCTGSIYCGSRLKAKVKIKNTGSTMINSFKLNCFIGPRVDCGAYYYQEKFSQLSLAPGDSITVTTNTLISRNIWPLTVPISTVQYCFYTTAPNDETDKTVEDNELCKTFSVDVTTSLKEVSPTENHLTVFPNPFENTISINSETEMRKIEVFNSLGILIDTHIINSKTFSYTEPKLITGFYFIKIETEKGTQIKKVVKQ